MPTSYRTRLAALSALCSLALAAPLLSPALAQDAPPPPKPAAKPDRIEDVVVTATRVKTRAERTAVALNVYSAQTLLNQGVHSVVGLQRIDPSVNVSTSSGASSVAIRGVTSTDRTEIGDPAVPIALDGFFVNRPYEIATAFYDVNQVEVLKGPQGTLFGRNSIGGLVNILTNRPTDQFGGYASLEAGSYNTLNAEGAINIPLASWASLRLSGVALHHDGYRQLVGIDKRGDDQNSQSGRAQLQLKPFTGFTGLISYQYTNVNEIGDVTKNGPLGVAIPLSPSHSFYYFDSPYNKLSASRIRWEFSYDKLPYGLSLIYAGGYDVEDWRHSLDSTTAQNIPQAYPAARSFIQHEQPKTWNQEVRLTTPQDWRLTAQAGYFHFSEYNTVGTGLYNDYALGSLPIPTSNYIGKYGIYFNYPEVYSQSDGYFAQANFKILPTLALSAGIRYTTDYKLRTGDATLNLTALASPFIPASAPPIVTPGNGTITENRPTYHAGLDWTPNRNILVYAKYDTGYKSGGFNSNGSAPSVPYGEETLKTWEIGNKNQLFHHTLELNWAAFYSQYDGYQAAQISTAIGGAQGVFNVGNATVKGGEAELNWLFTPLDRFNFNAAYIDSQFARNIIVDNGNSVPENVGGHQLPNAPPWVLTAELDHRFELGTHGDLTLGIDGKYSSHYYFDVFNVADTRSPAYFVGDLTATYVPPVGRWTVEAYIRNFTNAAVLTFAAENFVSFANTYEFAPPLTFGARLNYKF